MHFPYHLNLGACLEIVNFVEYAISFQVTHALLSRWEICRKGTHNYFIIKVNEKQTGKMTFREREPLLVTHEFEDIGKKEKKLVTGDNYYNKELF
jgi:hypothetical protein